MQKKSHLAVFVHGWGAGEEGWWGTTVGALQSRIDLANVHFHFHRYATTQTPQSRLTQWFRKVIPPDRKEQELGELGSDLWSSARTEYRRYGCRSLSLFGHSFGGLVVADAIGFAVRSAARGDKEDQAMLSNLTGIALCCSPIDGADLAATYDRLVKTFASNVHIRNLLRNSQKRRNVVNAFVNYLTDLAVKRPGILTVFRAADDAIVKSTELDGPFNAANVEFKMAVLSGAHSECVQNIEPGDPKTRRNFDSIIDWLRTCLPLETRDFLLAEKSPHAMRQSFDQLVVRLRTDIAAEPFRSWKVLRTRPENNVGDAYLLRIFLQQLIFAAARIDERALGSANLWVAHYEGTGSLHLRSEEREGYFATNQLVVYTGDFIPVPDQGGRVAIRANKVTEGPGADEANSAAALAYLRGDPQFVAMAKTDFPSESDRSTGVTHVLGIPLYSKTDLMGIPSSEVEGAPLAVTIDFSFEAEPSKEEVGAITSNAREIMNLFRALRNVWVDTGVRLSFGRNGSDAK